MAVDEGMVKTREGTPLRLLAVVAVMNGFVCIVGPVVVLVHGSASRPVPSLLLWMAAFALALTPLQLAIIWRVIGGRLKGLVETRRIRRRIDQVLAETNFAIAFQPIVDLSTGNLLGVEALSRFAGQPAATPDVWFADAVAVGRGLDLELLAVQIALTSAPALAGDPYVAVNVSPETLASPQLLALLLDSPIPTSRIVVEVTEHTAVEDYTTLLEPLVELRSHGVRLAIDDAGSGYASLRRIVALAPDIIKVDQDLLVGVDHDKARRALIAAVVMFALESEAVVVGEGVETLAELEALTDLGVDAAQGYFLARPTTSPDEWQRWATTELTTGATTSCEAVASTAAGTTSGWRAPLKYEQV